MIPNKGVIVIKLDKNEVKEGDVPDIVFKDLTPRIKEMEAKIAALLGGKA